MVVDGVTYTKDLKIFPDRIKPEWWRKQGHLLLVEDIGDIIEYTPEVLGVGKGAFGFMKISAEVVRRLESLGIKLIAEKTGEATGIFNRLMAEKKNVCAAFHLTC